MAFGVFGKLPQKRDFIALNIPRMVLEPFETWLQSAVAASRSELGASMAGALSGFAGLAFLDRRRDLRHRLCRRPHSVGRQGRQVLSAGDPVLRRRCSGHRRAAVRPARCMVRRDRGTPAQRAAGQCRDRSRPPHPRACRSPKALPRRRRRSPQKSRRGLVWQAASGGSADLLSALMAADYWASAPARSFWWTNGGGGSGPIVYVRNALPDPFFYANMIKGSVDAAS